MARDWKFTDSVLVFVLLIASGMSVAQTEQVLYSFIPADYQPGGVILDTQGNLYGATSGSVGSTYGYVFELSPSVSGWTETVLYTFPGGQGGEYPSPYQSLTFDTAGNLYGTTVRGGKATVGTIFRLAPKGKGTWTANVIHQFTNASYPEAGLVLDAAGNGYGTTTGGKGAVFEISPKTGYRVLHVFQQAGDGSGPWAALTIDSAGNLYGTTYLGGVPNCGLGGNGCGTVFKLTPLPNGGWGYKQIYRFHGGSDGVEPWGGVVVSAAGDVYGTTQQGGIGTNRCFSNVSGCGTVFKLSPNPDGSYTHTVIYAFLGPPIDGGDPQTGLIFDSADNLFGTTYLGGADGLGTVFELVPQQSAWHETILHSFSGGSDGSYPYSQLVIDSSGNIYGTTDSGGANGYGVAFEVTP